jgi:hypothetical protein
LVQRVAGILFAFLAALTALEAAGLQLPGPF